MYSPIFNINQLGVVGTIYDNKLYKHLIPYITMKLRRLLLSECQKKVYGYIIEYLHLHNFPPTVREIQRNFGYKSANSVMTHLKRLKEKGYITTSPNPNHKVLARTIQVVDEVMGYHTVDPARFSRAVAELKACGHQLPISSVIELLSKLNIKVI